MKVEIIANILNNKYIKKRIEKNIVSLIKKISDAFYNRAIDNIIFWYYKDRTLSIKRETNSFCIYASYCGNNHLLYKVLTNGEYEKVPFTNGHALLENIMFLNSKFLINYISNLPTINKDTIILLPKGPIGKKEKVNYINTTKFLNNFFDNPAFINRFKELHPINTLYFERVSGDKLLNDIHFKISSDNRKILYFDFYFAINETNSYLLEDNDFNEDDVITIKNENLIKKYMLFSKFTINTLTLQTSSDSSNLFLRTFYSDSFDLFRYIMNNFNNLKKDSKSRDEMFYSSISKVRDTMYSRFKYNTFIFPNYFALSYKIINIFKENHINCYDDDFIFHHQYKIFELICRTNVGRFSFLFEHKNNDSINLTSFLMSLSYSKNTYYILNNITATNLPASYFNEELLNLLKFNNLNLRNVYISKKAHNHLLFS